MRTTRALTICALLSLIGIGLAGYLTYLHIGLMRGDLLGGAACSGSGAFNCHAVTGGSWGSFLGVPLSLWGILGYFAVLAIALWGRQSAEASLQAAALITIVAAGSVAADLFLLGVQAVVLRAYCLFCLLTYVVNVLVLFVAWRGLAAAPGASVSHAGAAIGALMPSARQPASWLFWGMMLAAALGVAGVHVATLFLTRGSLGDVRAQVRGFLTSRPAVTIDTAGDPVDGPADALIRLVEFSDFRCPACQRASKFNRIVLANHRKDASLTFKHFPLDTACNDRVQRAVHPGACELAAASECVNQQGKFWPFHDRVFEQGPDYQVNHIERDVQELGLDLAAFHACMDAGDGMAAVKRDIAEAGKIGVQSTPTYVVNGIPMAGMLHPSMFEAIADVLKENR